MRDATFRGLVMAGTIVVGGCGLAPFGPALRGSTSALAQGLGQVATPDWAKNAVCYQIFPERFANGDTANDPAGVQPWGSKPTNDNFMGGDLEGVAQHLPYLHDLGITALYLNPIFTSSSNHKYNTIDYMHVDPHFGGDAAFQRLLKSAHAMGMKVILDGVFNHTSDENPFFVDCKQKGPQSPYWSWYTIYGFPIVTVPKPNYNSWWGFGTLPQWKAATNPDVQNYIYGVEAYWLKQGIDGWRLDVPNEIDNDAFWRGFRTRARAINPNAYIVGEIWTEADRWLQGDQFDSVMNYMWRQNVLGFFAQDNLDVDHFDGNLEGLRNKYQLPITQVMFNILGSHDVERFLTLAGGDERKLRLAALFQLTYPGTPVVYYGDEIGMTGGKDPDNRQCFKWNANEQNGDLKRFYKTLIGLRNANSALRTGSFRSIRRHNDLRLFAYVREDATQKITVMLNNSDQDRSYGLDVSTVYPDGTRLRDALSGKSYTVAGGLVQLAMGPKQGLILLPPSARLR